MNPPAPRSKLSSPEGRSPLSLVVSGSLDRAAALASLLRRGGSETSAAHGALEALHLLDTWRPDFVFTDITLPDMEASEFLTHMKSRRPEALRVLLGPNENKRSAMQVLSAGLVHRYVLVPWDDTAVLTLLREGRLLLDEFLGQDETSTVRQFSAVPTPPSFHLRLRAILTQGKSSISEIVEAIDQSPALVAKLLRVANSVYYGARNPITTVSEALMFIGTEYVISLVMAIEAFGSVCTMGGSSMDPAIDLQWNKALRRAALAKRIAGEWDQLQNPGLVHIVALLMDVGYVLRICMDPGRYHALIESSHARGCTPHEMETEFFPISHDRIGAALLRFWNLPEEIVDVIARHHGPAGGNAYILIAQIADILESGTTGIPHDPKIDPEIPLWREKLRSELLPPPDSPPAS